MMDIIDYEEPTKPQEKILSKKKIIIAFLLEIVLICCCQLDFIPILNWVEIILFSLFIVNSFVVLYIITPQKHHNKLVSQQQNYTLEYLGISGCGIILTFVGVLGIGFMLTPTPYQQILATTSGTFYVDVEGFATSSNFYDIKKSYPYSLILYSLDGWQMRGVSINIQLDTSNNIVSANGEPIWNLTTDEFIPRVNR